MRDILLNRPLPLVQTREPSHRVSWPCLRLALVRPFGERSTLALVPSTEHSPQLSSANSPPLRGERVKTLGWGVGSVPRMGVSQKGKG